MARTQRLTRAVWALVSRDPQQPIAAMARALGVTNGTIHRALWRLVWLGYLDITPGAARARRVRIPLIDRQEHDPWTD